MVLRRCRRLLADDELALDATQDVFVQLLRHESALTDTSPSSLLYRIASHVSLNRLRSNARSKLTFAADPLLSAIAELPAPESTSLTRTVLARLFAREPDSTRIMAVLHFVDGLTLEETAKEVGLSISGVRKRLKTLKERLGALAPEGTLS